MKEFYIGFSKNKQGKIFSKLLQWYMNKEYSHVFFELDYVVLHAELSDGVSYWTVDKFEQHNKKVKSFKVVVSDKYYDDMVTELEQHVGHKYALIQNLGIVMVDAMKALGMSISNPFRKGDNCSELVFKGLLEIYPDIASKYNINSIRPDHIEEILRAKGYKDAN